MRTMRLLALKDFLPADGLCMGFALTEGPPIAESPLKMNVI